jgi:hypothetical protein
MPKGTDFLLKSELERTPPPGQFQPAGETARQTEPVVRRSPEFTEEMPLHPRPAAHPQQDDISLTGEANRPDGLDKDILARAASSAHLPLFEGGRETTPISQAKVIQTRPLPHMATLPQARGQTATVEPGETAAWPDEPASPFTLRPQPAAPVVEHSPLPLVPPVRIEVRRESATPPEVIPPQPTPSPPAAPVQRQVVAQTAPAQSVDTPAAASTPPAVIQRAKEEKTATSDQPQDKPVEAPELDKLARQIYPLIKRMLAVERERRPIR